MGLWQCDCDAICANMASHEVILSLGIMGMKHAIDVRQFLGIRYGNRLIDMKH